MWYGHAWSCHPRRNGSPSDHRSLHTEGAGLEPVTDTGGIRRDQLCIYDAHACWQMFPVEELRRNQSSSTRRSECPVRQTSWDRAVRDRRKRRLLTAPTTRRPTRTDLIELDGLKDPSHGARLGTPLSDAHLEFLSGGVDILLALAGANLTIVMGPTSTGPSMDRPTGGDSHALPDAGASATTWVPWKSSSSVGVRRSSGADASSAEFDEEDVAEQVHHRHAATGARSRHGLTGWSIQHPDFPRCVDSHGRNSIISIDIVRLCALSVSGDGRTPEILPPNSLRPAVTGVPAPCRA